MLHLLRLEWYKFGKNNGLRAAAILYLILLPAALLAFREISLKTGNDIIKLGTNFVFPGIWPMLGYMANWLAFFILGFIGIQIISMEYSYKTLRQNVISGLERSAFVRSKLLTATILSLAATTWYVICGLVIGYALSDPAETAGPWSEGFARLLLRVFLANAGYTVLGMFLATLLRKGGTATFLYLLYGMFLENILRWWLHNQLFPGSITKHFYPVNALEDLAPLPYLKQMTDLADMQETMLLTPEQATGTAIVYLALMIALIYRKITRSDI